MDNVLENFSVSIQLLGDTITVNIQNAPVNVKYAYYLYFYSNQNEPKKTVQETKYINEPSYSFKIKTSGYYYVRCFVQTKNAGRFDKNTYTVLYLDDSFMFDFDQFMNKNLETINTINDKIPYFKVPNPQNDFCYIHNTKNTLLKTTDLTSWCSINQFDIKYLEGCGGYLIYSNCNTQHGLSDNRIFSGYAWVEESFYMGQENLKGTLDTKKLHNCYGMYTLFDINQDKIIITSDYFGFCRIFYYDFENMHIISNRYHLLIIILAKLGVKIILDEKMVRSIFASNVTLFRQTYTSALTVMNTYMLPITKQICISKNLFSIEDKMIQSIFDEPYNYDYNKYSELINKAKYELIDNVSALKRCGQFENIVLDLSGGKDSRTNLAAITNLPNYRDDYELRSDKHEPNDLEIAVGINNIFKIPYYTKGDIYYQNTPLDYVRKNRSYFCGYHYLWYFETKHSHNMKKLRVAAESFESFTVKYYSATVSSLDYRVSTCEEIVDVYLSLLSRQSMISFNDIASTVKSQLLDTLSEMKGCTPIEAFDNLLLFYRGTTHAGNFIRMYYASAYCMPLQSANLLRAKRMWINHFTKNKIIFDIIYSLNPLLLLIPFNAEKTNEALRLSKDILVIDEHYKDCIISIDSSMTKYNEAMNKYFNNTKTIINKNDKNEINSLGSIPEIVYDNCIVGLQKLSQIYNGLYRNMCMQIYFYLQNEKEDTDEVRILHNKIWSVLDCYNEILYE